MAGILHYCGCGPPHEYPENDAGMLECVGMGQLFGSPALKANILNAFLNALSE